MEKKMAITSGKPIITAGAGGFLHLAHVTKHGTQFSIENFLSAQEARDFCQQHEIRASLVIDGHTLTPQHCALLASMTGTLAPPSTIAEAAHTTVAWGKKALGRWISDGLACAGDETKKPGQRPYALTPSGQKLKAAIGS